MGTTAQKLQAIIDSKEAIRTAINNKGGSVLESTPLDEYATAIGNLTGDQLPNFLDNSLTSINSNVTSIVPYCFASRSELLSITLPNINEIKNYAFYYCSKLETITFGNITSSPLKDHAFSLCQHLTTINWTLPNSYSYSGDYVFQSCSSLESIDLHGATGQMSNHVFDGCTKLKNIDLGNTTQLTDSFSNCYLLENLTLRKSDTPATIPNATLFGSLYNMLTVHVPSSLIASYRTASNWSTLYNNSQVDFVAI